MSKSSPQSNILNKISKTLPDDRPITAIQIVEHIEKCPRGFYPIHRTHDQDQDADLWRESSLFSKKAGRYLCLSKTEGLPEHVIQEIVIISDKETPPKGYSSLSRTADTEQKAWRKKQICYRLVQDKSITKAVTDIIICNRIKHAPSGFNFVGEIHGLTVCFKLGTINDENKYITNDTPSVNLGSPPIPPLRERKNGTPNTSPSVNLRSPPERPPKPSPGNNCPYPLLENSTHDYERLLSTYSIQPVRPAPQPPGNNDIKPKRVAPEPPNGYNTLVVYNGLEGVPFILNSKLIKGPDVDKSLPVINVRSIAQLEKEYNYDFKVERCT